MSLCLLYSLLASVPALSCRLGSVAYNCAFGALKCCTENCMSTINPCSCVTKLIISKCVGKEENHEWELNL